MKILIVSDAWFPQVNGVVGTYKHIADELVKSGHDIKVIGPSDFPLRFPMPAYPEIELCVAPYRRLKKMIAEYAPDIIHIATEGPLGKAGRRYCMKTSFPFTTCYHTHFPDYIAQRAAKFMPFLYRPVKKAAIASIRAFHAPANAMMVATPSLEDELKSWGFKTPMHRLTRGVDIEMFRPGRKTEFKGLETPVALYVGRVAIEKNVEAFLQMEWNGSKVIVGEGPSKAMLEKKYPDARFVGKKTGEDLAAHFRSADIFVFPSRTDTFGMVLVEALASGLPIAAYDATGPRDIVTEDVLGALDDADLGAAARKALAVRAHGQARRDHAREHYTWPVAAEQFFDIITKT